jgi:DNA repair protein RecN (Recombination protein N)
MLVELRIRNVAVIDTVTLPFAHGLNVLTGETGAGKSLIITALGMLLGERAAADRIRSGSDKATVEGVFDLRARDAVRHLLDERGIDADEDLLVLKREIASGGRSRAWINGSPVTASVLAEIGSRLVSVHGQHDSRELLDPEQQRHSLDAYAQGVELRHRVQTLYDQVQALRLRERELEQRRVDAAKRADYLRFVVREIEETNPVPGEDEVLDADIRRLAHAEELQGLAAQAAAAIAGDERAALTRLGVVRKALASLTRIDPTTESLQTGFDAAVYALDELSGELERYAEGIDVDPERLRALERRRDALLALMRKYGPTLDEVRHTGRTAREELDLVDGGSIDRDAVAQARAAAEGELSEAAASLTRSRHTASRQFATAVSALLPELGMPDGRLEVSLTVLPEIGRDGAEQVQFQVALNAGSEMRPLSRVASGGELARVMLALSTVLARLQQVPTLVFDEVDAGVGGAVAWQVGALMRRVAAHHQVLSISHLAQIAARAHHHIVVRKSAVGTVTTSDTTIVDGEARVVEVARMLGGDADREISRAHARELLERGGEESASDTGSTTARGRGTQRRGKPV